MVQNLGGICDSLLNILNQYFCFSLTLLDHTLAMQGKILHTLTTISSTAHITAEMLKTIMYTLNYQNGMYIK